MFSRTAWKPGPAHAVQRSPSPPPLEAAEWLPMQDVAEAVSAYNKRHSRKRRRDAHGNGTYTSYTKRMASNGAMDALSSVALEYAPTSPQSHRHSTSAAAGMLEERSSKRARNEKYSSPGESAHNGRPTTSYTRPPPPLSQPTTQDAELLLNFFTAARATPAQPSPTASHTRSMSFGQSPAFVNRAYHQSSTDPLPQYQSAYAQPSQGFENQHFQRSPPKLPEPPLPTRDEAPPLQEAGQTPDGVDNSASGQAHNEAGILPNADTHTKQPIDVANNAPASGGTDGAYKHQVQASPVPQQVLMNTSNPGNTGSGPEPPQPQPAAVDPEQDVPRQQIESTSGPCLTSLPAQQMESIDSKQTLQRPQATGVDHPQESQPPKEPKSKELVEQICTECGFHRNNLTLETESENTSWISCDGCEKWFHFACAGFKSEREVRSVDKFRCKTCKPIHGPTTFVRKSSRAHAPIDYAELNQGVVKTSEESPEHHYIKPIKEGTLKFAPESFARIRPELITADFWLHGEGMQEPVVIPADWNPQARRIPRPEAADEEAIEDPADDAVLHDQSALDIDIAPDFEYQQVPDEGQDALDMVIPRDLTVRRVAELYGPEEKLEVIDVKSQNGEDKRWNMRKWADYYESDAPNKPVRNVISLEVSQSRLGSLIRRPKVVRDLDLQDSVWPQELIARGDYPKVQFYCLMSVADCYTDFHIDFGGSSVYYHIIKGKKTFFFIPPTETNLKKYEDWCNSEAQNYTFLGDQTKTCYRVDLGPGDTMLIPAGWIHAVWTPEDSLVIGGNFLTRQNYPMQIRITQIEKATGVARKFRYPSFQKIMWYAVIRYLSEDPLPKAAEDILLSGKKFEREVQTWEDYHAWGENSHSGPGTEHYHSRYYPKCELDGLPELARYIQRTAYIAAGYVTDGVSSDTKRAVQRSIPKEYKHHGSEPVDCVRKFAIWYCWKRGNELLPHWAYPDYVPEANAPEVTQKKLSMAHQRRLEREAAMTAERVSDRPQRERKQPSNLYNEMMTEQEKMKTVKATSPSVASPLKQETPVAKTLSPNESPMMKKESQPKKRKSSGGVINRQPACESCRKGRRACKHREQDGSSALGTPTPGKIAPIEKTEGSEAGPSSAGVAVSRVPSQAPDVHVVVSGQEGSVAGLQSNTDNIAAIAANASMQALKDGSTLGRSKACADCRKSKRRCIHDEFGRQDPVKMAQAAQPRPAAKKKRPSDAANETPQPKKVKKTTSVKQFDEPHSDMQTAAPMAPMAPMMTALPTVTQQPTPVLPSDNLSQPDEEIDLVQEAVHGEVKAEVTELPNSIPQDTSSALVSPPESTHTDPDQTASPAHTPKPSVEAIDHGEKGRDLTPPTTASAPRSRRPSQLPAKPAGAGDDRSRAVSTASTDSKILDAMMKRRASSNTINDVDEESLRLIKDLAAQDRGLRRRESRPA